MGEYHEDVASGTRYVTQWAEERFPNASTEYVGYRPAFHAWLVDFGPGIGLRLGVTERALEDEDILKARLAELDDQGWMDDVETESKWLVVNAAGIVERSPAEW